MRLSSFQTFCLRLWLNGDNKVGQPISECKREIIEAKACLFVHKLFNWKIEFYSPEMVVGNGWGCLFGFLFEISFRCERELNAKPRVRTNPMAVLRLLGMVMALGRLLLQKGTTKVQSCQYCLKSKLFFKKGDDVSDFKKALSKKVRTKLLFYNFIKHETQDFSFLFNKNQSNIWRPWNSSSF